MYREFYSQSTLLHLPLVAMALFILGFLIAAFYALRRAGGPDDEITQLPLTDDDRLTSDPALGARRSSPAGGQDG